MKCFGLFSLQGGCREEGYVSCSSYLWVQVAHAGQGQGQPLRALVFLCDAFCGGEDQFSQVSCKINISTV